MVQVERRLPPWRIGALFALTVGVTLACTSSAPLPPKAILLNQDGADALARGDLPVAEARLAVALEYNPRFTEAWVNLGLVEMQRGNFEAARKDLEKAKGLNPDLPAPHHALGLLAERRGRGTEAERHYRDALKVDPGFAPARANLARRLLGRGALEEAREQYLRLTEVVPEALEGWTGLAEALLRLGREAEAEAVVTRALGRFPGAPTLVVLEARGALQGGAFDEAERLLLPLTGVGGKERPPAAPLAGVTSTDEVSVGQEGEVWAWIALARLAAGRAREAAVAEGEAERLAPGSPLVGYVAGQVARGAAGGRAASR